MFQLHCLHNHKLYEEINLNMNTKYEYGQDHETSLCSRTDTFWIFWSILPKLLNGIELRDYLVLQTMQKI